MPMQWFVGMFLLLITVLAAIAMFVRMSGNRRPWTTHATLLPCVIVFAYGGWAMRSNPFVTGSVGRWFYACSVMMLVLWALEVRRRRVPRGWAVVEPGPEQGKWEPLADIMQRQQR